MPSRPLINLIELLPTENVLGDTSDIDYFEDSLSSIFNDARNQHGEPGENVLYKSEVYFGKDIKLGLADPRKEDNGLFAHFLWNAGVQAAEMIASGEFVVRGERVLELGAGAGLPGIVAALSGAYEVVISDYPAPEIISNIDSNIKRNISLDAVSTSKVSVRGHIWGELDASVGEAAGTQVLLTNSHAPHSFTRIIVADCMWMDWQHENLCSSIAHFLEQKHGELLAIAGFHTGRPKVVNFFKECEKAGLCLIGTIVEKDVDGVEREWCEDRGLEDVIERKRWLTISKFRLGRNNEE